MCIIEHRLASQRTTDDCVGAYVRRLWHPPPARDAARWATNPSGQADFEQVAYVSACQATSRGERSFNDDPQ